jgi:acyl-coenzyme A thioesterase PaaI-like protein
MPEAARMAGWWRHCVTSRSVTVAAGSEGARYLTTALHVDYLAAAQQGERLTVIADRVRAGNTLGFAQGAVMVGDRWIANASGVFTAQRKPTQD